MSEDEELGRKLPTVIDKKLGRRPPTNKPAIMFSTIRNEEDIPQPPKEVDNFIAVAAPWILGGNDKFGTCGPTSVANLLLLITKMATGVGISVADEDVFDLYRRSGNPNFDPNTGNDDNGVDMQTMLKALITYGIAGHKPLAFVKLNHNNLNELRYGMYIFGGLLFGVNLEEAQQSQTVWDYQHSADWGGHAIMSGKYDTTPDITSCITWAQVMGMTDEFLEKPGYQLEEVWGVFWPETINNLTPAQLNLLATEYKALTGKDFPLPVPPIPAPIPTPTPVPVTPTSDQYDKTLALVIKPWVALKHYGQNKVVAKALIAWLKNKSL